MQETAKRCPSCGMAIQKSEGCNKMTCGACGAAFCWRCSRAVDGYDHFRAGACVLFDHGEIQRWEVELQVQIERQAPRLPCDPLVSPTLQDAADCQALFCIW